VPGEAPITTVVIPVRDEERRLPGCLDALSVQEGAPSFEVIVVDNGSTDATRVVASRHPIHARVLEEHARGPYAARNAGIGAARGELIALTDADCHASPKWLSAGVAALKGGADLVGGAIKQRATSVQPNMWERYDRATYLRQRDFIEHECFAATANLFVRREVFERVGPFRPELVASGDLEFGQRATKAGYVLVFSPDAEVSHEPRTTLRDTWKLHRKLGSGFGELARSGLRGPAWSDLALRISFGMVAEQVAEDGPAIRRRHLAPYHLVAVTARWVGRLTARG